MADILQDLPINASPERVFEAISSTAGLARWWALSAKGVSAPGAQFELSFGPACSGQARVTCYQPCTAFELEMTSADADWTGTRVRLEVEPRGSHTWLRFRHTGWPYENEHYRISGHCWAMYLPRPPAFPGAR